MDLGPPWFLESYKNIIKYMPIFVCRHETHFLYLQLSEFLIKVGLFYYCLGLFFFWGGGGGLGYFFYSVSLAGLLQKIILEIL